MTRLVGAAVASVLLVLTAFSYGMKLQATSLPVPVFPVLTIVFITSGSVIVAYVAGRAYVKGGLASTLFVGSGSLIFGSTSLVAALMAGQDGSNAATTIFVSGALAASALHLSCAASRFVSGADRVGSRTVVGWTTVLSLLFVVAVTAAAVYGWLPRFFNPDVGTTWAARAALVAAISTFLLASLLIGFSSKSVILYWYSWALGVTAIGLIGLLVSDWLFENVVFWVGRIALCLGGVFLVFSIIAAERGSDAPEIGQT